RSPCPHELSLQFRLPAHQELLHFLGGFVLVILTQITVATSNSNFLRISRNPLLDEFGIFVLPALQTFPGNNQRGLLSLVFSRDERLHGRITFDDAREQ